MTPSTRSSCSSARKPRSRSSSLPSRRCSSSLPRCCRCCGTTGPRERAGLKRTMPPTHEVANQAPPLENYNLFDRNRPLMEAVAREGAADALTWLGQRGAELGSAEMIALGVAANRNPPTPKLFDRTGRRCDEVEFHPAYHELMAYLKRHGASAGPWAHPAPGAHVKRAALFMLYAEIEDGTLCPTTMTYAVVPSIVRDETIARPWLPRIYS